jgi:hypothetical protein
MGQLKWRRLTPFEKLADTQLKHLEGKRRAVTNVDFVAVQRVRKAA